MKNWPGAPGWAVKHENIMCSRITCAFILRDDKVYILGEEVGAIAIILVKIIDISMFRLDVPICEFSL